MDSLKEAVESAPPDYPAFSIGTDYFHQNSTAITADFLDAIKGMNPKDVADILHNCSQKVASQLGLLCSLQDVCDHLIDDGDE